MPVSSTNEYHAVVVGSGPNGLAAALRLQEAGLSVLVLEKAGTIGGGTRSAQLTLPGFVHDVCSAIHPLTVGSPFFRSLPLKEAGLEFIHPPLAAAHPLDDGTCAVLSTSLEETAALLGADGDVYRSLMKPMVERWSSVESDILGPLRFPSDPLAYSAFGLRALTSANFLSRKFSTPAGKSLWAGMSGHSMQPFSNLATSAVGLVLLATGHVYGWPFPRGGSENISRALAACFLQRGGVIETNTDARSMGQLPSSDAVLFDITPRQLLAIEGLEFSALYRRQLQRYRYGMGVFKIDWALSEPAPFRAEACRRAGTLHLGNTYGEIAEGERQTWKGRHAEKPFVLYAQHSVFDTSRAPQGKHTGWAYCHVPHGSTVDMTERIEKQMERFAPGFRDLILARHTFNSAEMEIYNPNYVGGDINGGVNDIRQIFTRPALRPSPYRTSAKGVYICSSSTPPGGGVHGMCGMHAADRVLRDMFPDRREK